MGVWQGIVIGILCLDAVLESQVLKTGSFFTYFLFFVHLKGDLNIYGFLKKGRRRKVDRHVLQFYPVFGWQAALQLSAPVT